MIDLITEIIEKKWKELDSLSKKEESVEEQIEKNKYKLIDILVNLDSINDFEREYEGTLFEAEKRKLSLEKVNELIFNVYEKWTFVFCLILNFDASNPFVLTYMHTALVSLMEEE